MNLLYTLWKMFSFLMCKHLEVNVWGHVNVYLTLEKIYQLFSKVLYHFVIFLSTVGCFKLLCILPNSWFCQSLNCSHSSDRVAVHCFGLIYMFLITDHVEHF